MSREKAVPTIQVNDEKIRVTRWDFTPGAETGWHTHGMDYVVVPLTDGTLLPRPPACTASKLASTPASAPQPSLQPQSERA